MSAPSRHPRSLSWLLQTASIVGISVALASASAHATPGKDAPGEDTVAKDATSGVGADSPGVAARLQAIRDAVSQLPAPPRGGPAAETENGDIKLAWWGNWNPWGNGWRNGGWRNGGWGNGGWRNGWPNGGWGNGWHNGGWGNWRNW
jgi:rSAM-associated Gly-rich repeat protein